MQGALYAPELGYYTGGLRKLATRDTLQNVSGISGDFVTAPELSPVFGQTLAQQFSVILRQQSRPKILEFGAGSGQLAHDLLATLSKLDLKPEYWILDVSADLRARQADRLACFGTQVKWLDQLPASFEGVVIANEVLDAMPVHLVGWTADLQVFERGVVWQDDHFAWHDQLAPATLAQALAKRMPALPGYLTEINQAAQAWTQAMAKWLRWGAAFIIDYGFPANEYYHPQRREGTLMCHIQHRSHSNPLIWPGLQDITAHIDFSAIAHTAHDAGLDVLGYTSQARFLLNAGLLQQISDTDLQQRWAIDKLISEAQMGELFKVLAVGRGVESTLDGFARGDRRHQL